MVCGKDEIPRSIVQVRMSPKHLRGMVVGMCAAIGCICQSVAEPELSVLVPKLIPFTQTDLERKIVEGEALRTLDWAIKDVPLASVPEKQDEHPGYALVTRNCTRCHLRPTPEQLPRHIWPFAIMWMANYLGYPNNFGPFTGLSSLTLIPPAPIASIEELGMIAEFFQIYSTDQDAIRLGRKNPSVTDLFKVNHPETAFRPEDTIAMVKIHEPLNQIFFGTVAQSRLVCYSTGFDFLYSYATKSEPAAVEVTPWGVRYSAFGDFLRDKGGGYVADLKIKKNIVFSETILAEGFPRVSGHLSEDLDGDGALDLVVLGFGGEEYGKVSLFWGKSDATYGGEQILLSANGAVKVDHADFTGNGKMDLVVAIAQGRQEIVIFEQLKKRQFVARVAHKEIAGFGYNDFELVDMDGDGSMDIVTSAGNNAEIPEAPLKRHHGIRVMRNQGDGVFSEAFFYPLFGALRTSIADFDKDGDIDIAGIALYPDWKLDHPETFVYLENVGNFGFNPSGLATSDWGRWMSIDSGDIDDDGDLDLVLGGAYHPLGVPPSLFGEFRKKIAGKPSVVVLVNQYPE
jgi:hypothetical protein